MRPCVWGGKGKGNARQNRTEYDTTTYPINKLTKKRQQHPQPTQRTCGEMGSSLT